ncbi:MAG: threonylcarbamoyl-AMP synthase [Coraliomargarita sp.]|nr:threonylcarbamoyl-AMP synthase [Coraliomargarita sp.]
MSAPTICLGPTAQNLEHCAELLKSGELVAIPTETVYGLAGNALDENAVRKIFEVKGRPLIDPLICHFDSLKTASAHVEVNRAAKKLAATYWPGALTLVLNKRSSIPDIVTAGLESAAIRVPAHPVLRKLLKLLEFPLAAPSANPFGYVSPTLAEHVERTLGNKLKAILDAGSCDFGVESTIVDLRDQSQPTVLRHGPVSIEELSKNLGKEIIDATHSRDDTANQSAPGLLTQHYSPSARVVLHGHGECPLIVPSNEATVFNQKPADPSLPKNAFWLSENGDNTTIAHNLFEFMQRLDQQQYTTLHFELSDGTGIGKAINDRLTRAAAK